MCLLIATAILFAGFNFYEHGLIPHSIISFAVASLTLGIFLYRFIKNRKCIFGNSKDCK